MKMKVIAMLAALALTASAAAAQELPRKVNNVEVLDLDGNPTVTSRTTTSRSSWRRTTALRATIFSASA